MSMITEVILMTTLWCGQGLNTWDRTIKSCRKEALNCFKQQIQKGRAVAIERFVMECLK